MLVKSFIKALSVATLLGSVSLAANASVDMEEVKAAQEQVNDYRALRRACAITQGEQRRVCFSQLHDATPAYKKAKQVLSLYQNAEQPLIGQAQ